MLKAKDFRGFSPLSFCHLVVRFPLKKSTNKLLKDATRSVSSEDYRNNSDTDRFVLML